MYTTAKEVHVYIDGAIQNVHSNRKQSVSPQFIDMVLNNAVEEYICSRFPERSQGKDVESTLKRYTDFSVLKTSKVTTPFIVDSFPKLARVKAPTNAIKLFANMFVSYIKPYVDQNKVLSNDCILELRVNDNIVNSTSSSINFVYTEIDPITKQRVSRTVNFNITNAITSVGTTQGAFYVYEYIVDVLRNVYNLQVSYDASTIVEGERLITIYFPITSIVVSYVNKTNLTYTLKNPSVTIPKVITGDVVKSSALSFMSSSEIRVALSDYYATKNLHLNPIGEITSDGIDIYYTDFLPTSVTVTYLRKPKLFDIRTGQTPEINITKDFLDYAVKEFLLILNSPTYDRVAAETIKNQ